MTASSVIAISTFSNNRLFFLGRLLPYYLFRSRTNKLFFLYDLYRAIQFVFVFSGFLKRISVPITNANFILLLKNSCSCSIEIFILFRAYIFYYYFFLPAKRYPSDPDLSWLKNNSILCQRSKGFIDLFFLFLQTNLVSCFFVPLRSTHCKGR